MSRDEVLSTGPEDAPRKEPSLGYDPGWTSATWEGGAPAPLPTPSLVQKFSGALRLIAFVVVTIVLLPPFFVARSVDRAFGSTPANADTEGARAHRRRWDRRVIALWCGLGARLCGLRIRRRGAPMPSGGALMVNHSSWLDILVIGAVAPVHFVAKAEVSGWPFFGWIGRISDTVFIARKRGEAQAQQRLLSARGAAGDLLCIFPEGTSSDGLRVLRFKTALFAMGVSEENGRQPPLRIQPLALRYHSPAGMPPSFHGWWGRMALFGHIWSVVCLGAGGAVDVAFASPLTVAPQDSRKTLAARAEAAVRAAHADAAGEDHQSAA